MPRVLAVTADEVARAAQRYLRAENRTIGWFEARSGDESLGDTDGRATIRGDS